MKRKYKELICAFLLIVPLCFSCESGTKSSGRSSNPNDTTTEETSTGSEYPEFTLYGTGTATYQSKSISLTQELKTAYNEDILTIEIVDFQGSNTELASKFEDQKGKTVYYQSDSSLLDTEGIKVFIFANKIKKADGTELTIDPFLPIFPMPAPLTRYEYLDSGKTLSYTAKVTGGGKSFTATIEGRKATNHTLGDYGLTMIVKITDSSGVEDTTGEFYGFFPVPKQATYGLDTDKRLIRSIQNKATFNENGSKGEVVLNHKLCQSLRNGKVEFEDTCR